MDKNYELEIYKLIMNPDEDDSAISYVDEFGWINDCEFIVWINIVWFHEFIKQLREIFDETIFDEGGFEATIGPGYVCIDLVDILSGYDIDFEEVFPKSKFTH